MLNGLDLFSGIGGISLALEPWVRSIAYCESDRYAQSVLLSRMSDGLLPRAGIWDDVRTLHASHISSPEVGFDIISAGFPCQDISTAGHGKGLEGERSGLFWEVVRLAKEGSPKFIFLENVPAIRTRGLETVINALAHLRYDCRWTSLSAAELGAPHIRKRWFLLGHAKHHGLNGTEISRSNGEASERRPESGSNEIGESQRTSGLSSDVPNADSERVRHEQQREPRRQSDGICNEGEIKPKLDGSPQPMADLDGERLEISQPSQEEQLKAAFGKDWWSVEPAVGRVVDGLPNRVDRIKCLGNAVVPLQAREAFKRLIGISTTKGATHGKEADQKEKV